MWINLMNIHWVIIKIQSLYVCGQKNRTRGEKILGYVKLNFRTRFLLFIIPSARYTLYFIYIMLYTIYFIIVGNGSRLRCRADGYLVVVAEKPREPILGRILFSGLWEARTKDSTSLGMLVSWYGVRLLSSKNIFVGVSVSASEGWRVVSIV